MSAQTRERCRGEKEFALPVIAIGLARRVEGVYAAG